MAYGSGERHTSEPTGLAASSRGVWAFTADVDLLRLASELVVDAVVAFEDLRGELILRLARGATRNRHFSDRRHGVPPV